MESSPHGCSYLHFQTKKTDGKKEKEVLPHLSKSYPTKALSSNSLGFVGVVLVVVLVFGQSLSRARVSHDGRQWGDEPGCRCVLRVATWASAIIGLHGGSDARGVKSTLQRLCVEDDVSWTGRDVELSSHVALQEKNKNKDEILHVSVNIETD